MYILREYRDIKAYQEDFSNKKIPLPSHCPACYFKILHRHSIYDRGIRIRDKETEKLEDLVVGILVVRCANPDPCPQRHHALLPAFLYPYRRIGPEVTEETFHSLVTDGTKSTRSFEIEGISRRLVRRWIQWFLNWFPASTLDREILKLSPGFPLSALSLIRLSPREGNPHWRSPMPSRWSELADRLSRFQALHAARGSFVSEPDPSPLRRHLGDLWQRKKLLLLFSLHPQ